MVHEIFENYLNIRNAAIEQTKELNKRFGEGTLDPASAVKAYAALLFPKLAHYGRTPKAVVLYCHPARVCMVDPIQGEPTEHHVEYKDLTASFVSQVTGSKYNDGEILLLEFKH